MNINKELRKTKNEQDSMSLLILFKDINLYPPQCKKQKCLCFICFTFEFLIESQIKLYFLFFNKIQL